MPRICWRPVSGHRRPPPKRCNARVCNVKARTLKLARWDRYCTVDPRAWLAEGLATYALVFFGPLSIIVAIAYFGDGLNPLSVLFISLAHGGTIGIMIYAFGHISGAHINPAVTIPMMIVREIPVKDGIAYVGAQVAGAIVATLTLLAIFPELGMAVNLGTQPGPGDILNNSAASGFAVEAILTFFLLVTICMTAAHKKSRRRLGRVCHRRDGLPDTLGGHTPHRGVGEPGQDVRSGLGLGILGVPLDVLGGPHSGRDNSRGADEVHLPQQGLGGRALCPVLVPPFALGNLGTSRL